MSRLTNSAVFLVAGILVGFLCQALAPHDPIAQERAQAVEALAGQCATELSSCAAHLGRCAVARESARKQADIVDALQGEVR
jgi:hypothetical protein